MKGLFVSPRNFKDRLMMTDVGESFFNTLKENGKKLEFRLEWNKDYYPWLIQVKVDNVPLLLQTEVIGKTNWQSLVTISLDSRDTSRGDKYLTRVMSLFLKKLDRDPLHSPYWGELDHMELFEKKGLALSDMKEKWASLAE